MLIATPKRWLSWDYEVRDAIAQHVGDVWLSVWRTAGGVRAGEVEYRVARRGSLSGPIMLIDAGEPLIRARRLGLFSSAVSIEFAGREFTLRAPSWCFREMRLFEDDREIGTAVPEGVFSRRAQFDLPESLPIELRLFIVWLVLYTWRRRRESSASLSGVLQAAPRSG